MTDKKDRIIEYRIWFEENVIGDEGERIPIDEVLGISTYIPQSMVTGEWSKVAVSNAMDKLKKKLLEEMEETEE